MYNIAFVGAPGAGKGTQAAAVARKFNLAHLATGDLFRQAARSGDELGIKVKEYMARGELVPDDITLDLVLGRLAAGKTGVALDGFPRNLRQAEALDEALAGRNMALDKVVYIKVPVEEFQRRLSGRRVCQECQTSYTASGGEDAAGQCRRCGGKLVRRTDDEPETVRKRHGVFMAETEPLVGYYDARGKLVEVAGQGSVAEVTGRVISALGRQESLA